MAYCRPSTDDFQCDVYAYDGTAGYTIHVANRRRVIPPERLPAPLTRNCRPEEALRRHRQMDRLLTETPWEELSLPYAGQTLMFETLEELRDMLLELRGLGYRVPDSALALIDEELAEAKT